MKTTGLLILFTLFVALGMFAQNDLLDHTFGDSGITSVPGTTEATLIAFDNDKNIITAGYTILHSQDVYYCLTLAKTNADGIIDPSFGNNGVVYTQIGYTSAPYAIAIQTDNKILVGGQFGNVPPPQGPGGNDMFVARYNPDGSLDNTFGEKGLVSFGRIGSHVNAIYLFPDNSILLTGVSSSCSALLIKLKEDGTTDESFGDNGVVSFSTPDNTLLLSPALLLSDNTILCIGSDFSDTNNSKLACAKIDMNGNFDTNFGHNGLWTYNAFVENDFDLGYEYSSNAVELPDGKIILKGSYLQGVLIRINADGTTDESFGDRGIVKYDFPHHFIELQDDDKILLGGSKRIYDNHNGTVYSTTRLNADGTLDTSFNQTGFFDLYIKPGGNYLQFMKIQDKNKLVMAGCIRQDDDKANFGLARIILNNNNSHNPSATDTIQTESPLKETVVFDINGRRLPHTGKLPTGVYILRKTYEDGSVKVEKTVIASP